MPRLIINGNFIHKTLTLHIYGWFVPLRADIGILGFLQMYNSKLSGEALQMDVSVGGFALLSSAKETFGRPRSIILIRILNSSLDHLID